MQIDGAAADSTAILVACMHMHLVVGSGVTTEHREGKLDSESSAVVQRVILLRCDDAAVIATSQTFAMQSPRGGCGANMHSAAVACLVLLSLVVAEAADDFYIASIEPRQGSMAGGTVYALLSAACACRAACHRMHRSCHLLAKCAVSLSELFEQRSASSDALYATTWMSFQAQPCSHGAMHESKPGLASIPAAAFLAA